MARNRILGHLGAALALSLVLTAVRSNADQLPPILCGFDLDGYPSCVCTPPKADLCCCDDECQNQSSWVGGVDMLFLGSKVQGGTVSATVDGGTADSSGLDRFGYAPRVWLGYQGECWGLYTRFFHLEESNQSFDPALSLAEPRGLGFNNSLTAYYTDLELVRTFGAEDSPMYAGFGVRYGALQSNASLWMSNSTITTTSTASAMSDRGFFGTGLTGGVWGKTPISSDSNLSVFWGARGSILWGDSTVGAMTSASALDDPSAAAVVNGALGKSSGNLGIGEMTLGVQWDHQLKCLPATAFFRVAGEYQIWYDNISGAAFSNSNALAIGNVGAASGSGTATAGDLKLQLYGFSLGAGFMW